ncbi:hypothetical protein ACO0K3_03775 [Undibacterium sp. Rencai35W]|uniref:hypothetical protein n=1 Tax=Undibacterium sp. Rencai35W TaxID=3413046 RepID=UPI003BF07DD1
MAQKGEFKSPVETMHETHRRAMRAFFNCDCRIALFMIAGKLSSSTEDSEQYQERVDRFAAQLIGVYDQTIDVRQIYDDIKVYYIEHPYIPVFRSSGRRIKQ